MREWLTNKKRVVFGIGVLAILVVFVWSGIGDKLLLSQQKETATTFNNAKITTKYAPEVTYDKDGRVKETVYKIGFTAPGQNGTVEALVSEGLYKTLKPDTTATFECLSTGSIRRINAVTIKNNTDDKKAP